MLPDNDLWLDHIAVATTDLKKSEKIFSDFGLKFNHREEVASESVLVSFAPIGDRANLELLKPTSEKSSVAQFITKRGEGIHHIAFMTSDLTALEKSLREKGYQLLYPSPKKGAHGKMINFVHPKSTGGVLVEISQKA